MNPRTRLLNLFAVLALALGLAPASALARNAVVIQADFGGVVMVGVCHSISSDLAIFRITPPLPRHDIEEAGRSLLYNSQTWPAGTVFVSVVDPGVGTGRKSVVLKTKNGLYFVSPDNGTLALVAKEYGIEGVREIDEKVNRRPGTEWSHTFHGRDVYAYTAGRLAAGVITYEQVGPLLEAKVVPFDYPAPTVANGTASGMIDDSSEDGFGNIACRIDRHTFDQLALKEADPVVVTIRQAGKVIWEETVPYVRTFGDVPVGKNLLFINSSGFVSMAINQGNFAETYHIHSGREWTLSVRRK
jgi:S-adenosylmethionine hydrolase